MSSPHNFPPGFGIEGTIPTRDLIRGSYRVRADSAVRRRNGAFIRIAPLAITHELLTWSPWCSAGQHRVILRNGNKVASCTYCTTGAAPGVIEPPDFGTGAALENARRRLGTSDERTAVAVGGSAYPRRLPYHAMGIPEPAMLGRAKRLWPASTAFSSHQIGTRSLVSAWDQEGFPQALRATHRKHQE